MQEWERPQSPNTNARKNLDARNMHFLKKRQGYHKTSAAAELLQSSFLKCLARCHPHEERNQAWVDETHQESSSTRPIAQIPRVLPSGALENSTLRMARAIS